MVLGSKPQAPGGVRAALKGSPRQVAIGVLLFLATGGFVFFNETRSVARYTALDQSADTVISIAPDHVDPSHEGALVHVRGGVQSTQELVDETFGVKAQALRLVRHVEIYSWEETKRDEKRKNDKGEDETVTTYAYAKRFFATPPDSSKFKEAESHKNVEKAAFTDQDFVAKDARLGAFVIPSEALGKLTKLEPVRVGQDMLARSAHASQLRELEGAAFFGRDVKDPQIGDLRVSYQMVRPQAVSLVAKQSGGTFVAYQPTPDESVFLVQAGEVESRAMFNTAKDDTSTVGLVLRALAVLFATIALSFVLVPIASARLLVPGLSRVPRFSAVVAAVGFGVAGVLATMGGVWVAVRPALGVPLFLASAVCLGLTAFGVAKAKRA